MTVASSLREALGIVRNADPNAIKQLDEAERAKADEAAREAKRTADARAKVEAALSGRVEALVADYYELERAAVQQAAERLAREQLEAESGLIPASALAFRGGFVSRLTADLVARAFKSVAASAAVGWDKAGRSGQALASARTMEAAEAAHPVVVLDHAGALEAAAKAGRELHERRQRVIADRKRARGLPGYRDAS